MAPKESHPEPAASESRKHLVQGALGRPRQAALEQWGLCGNVIVPCLDPATEQQAPTSQSSSSFHPLRWLHRAVVSLGEIGVWEKLVANSDRQKQLSCSAESRPMLLFSLWHRV